MNFIMAYIVFCTRFSEADEQPSVTIDMENNNVNDIVPRQLSYQEMIKAGKMNNEVGDSGNVIVEKYESHEKV